jgi:hypothetical protein
VGLLLAGRRATLGQGLGPTAAWLALAGLAHAASVWRIGTRRTR